MVEQNYITTFDAEKDKRHGDGFVSFDQKTLKPNVRTQNRPLSYPVLNRNCAYKNNATFQGVAYFLWLKWR